MAKDENYTIIDWIIAHENQLGLDFKDDQDTSANLVAVAKKIGDKSFINYLKNTDDFMTDISSKSKHSIDNEIENRNEDWKQLKLTDINNATDEDDIGTIQDELDRESYRQETIDYIQIELDKKEDEVAGKEEVERLRKEIEKAKTAGQLEKLEIERVAADIPSTKKKELGDLILDRTSEFVPEAAPIEPTEESLAGEFLRDFSPQIASADELDRLKAEVESDAPTFGVESTLLGQIEDRRSELS